MNEKKNDKSNYALNKNERAIMLNKIIPTLLIGNLIWLISTIMFIFLYTTNLLGMNFWLIYFIILFVSIIIILLLHISAKKDQELTLMVLFIIFSLLSGIHGILFVNLNLAFTKQVLMFVTANLGGTLIVYLIGFSLRDKFMADGYIWLNILLFLIFLGLISSIYYLIFGIQNWVLTVPITLSYFSIISLIILFYGSLTVQNLGERSWTYVIYKILRVLLLSIIVAIVIAVIVLIFIVLGILGGEDLDFSGLNFLRSGKKKKKKQTQE